MTRQAQGERIFLLSTHRILMLSLLSWGEYWPVPLQSPENQRSLKGKDVESWSPSHFGGEGPPTPNPSPASPALASEPQNSTHPLHLITLRDQSEAQAPKHTQPPH